MLDFWHVSSTILGSKVPIERVADLNGLKVAIPTAQGNNVLAALGASQVAMPAGKIVTALERGALDSSPVPLDARAAAFGFTPIVSNYVDRLYKPRLYAVVITEDRWKAISYPEQYAMARAAVAVGERLVISLDAQAQVFRQSELARGAAFAHGIQKM